MGVANKKQLGLAQQATWKRITTQKLRVGGRDYVLLVGDADRAWHLIVERNAGNRSYLVLVSRDEQGARGLSVVRNQDAIFGPAYCSSKAEAKLIGHIVAVDDAGLDRHYCNGECVAWQQY